MATFRTVLHRNPADPEVAPQQSTSDNNTTAGASASTSADARPNAAAGGDVSGSTSETPAQQSSGTSMNSSGLPRPPVLFRLPFNGADGTPALLAFHPQPLPSRDSDQPAGGPQTSQTHPSPQSPSSGSTEGEQSTQASTAASNGPHSHPHPDGHVPVSPLFVPFGASPLPFSFIYDAHTQSAWPIVQVTPGSPPGGPSPDAPESQQPRLVAGPPFRIILDVHFSAPPEPEQPDEEKAAKYVKQLERADAELRSRMARLGMGSIGGFGEVTGSDDQDALLGCGICLDNYEADDRPEWIDGPKSQDEAVVAVPCQGHHTLHAGCLKDWLAKLPPSQWTCPFCRASLKSDTASIATSASPPRGVTKPASSSAPVHTSLRDEVRARERQRGWKCDAPACLPRYPVSSRTDGGHLDLPETNDDMSTDLVKLTPCRHEVHLDCLCTSMRVENDLTCAGDLDAIMSSDEEEEPDEESGQQSVADLNREQEERKTIGKWVTCPTCRKECWAELPLRRKPQRSVADVPADQPKHEAAFASASTESHSDTKPDPAGPQLEAEVASKTVHAPDVVSGHQMAEGANMSTQMTSDPDEEEAVDAILSSS